MLEPSLCPVPICLRPRLASHYLLAAPCIACVSLEYSSFDLVCMRVISIQLSLLLSRL